MLSLGTAEPYTLELLKSLSEAPLFSWFSDIHHVNYLTSTNRNILSITSSGL